MTLAIRLDALGRNAFRLGAAAFAVGILPVGARADSESVGQAREPHQVTVNGRSSSAVAPYFAIFPGRANTLTLRANPAAIGGQAVTATLLRTRPDGVADETTVTLSGKAPEGVFDLGAFAVPAEYDYEHGVVYRRGYRFKLTVADAAAGKPATVFNFFQGPARAVDSEALWIGDVARQVYNSGYDAGKGWQPNKESGRPMDPPFLLQLDWAVLSDPNDVRIQFRHRDGLAVGPLPAKLLVVRMRDGKTVVEREVMTGPVLVTEKVDVSGFADGDYRIELQPAVTDTVRREGPRLVYRRKLCDPADVRVSPLAPWTLRRDPARAELRVVDFGEAVARWGNAPVAGKWSIGRQLLGEGDISANPVVLRPGLRGHYAIFARVAGTCFVKAGRDAAVRRLGAYTVQVPQEGEQFVVATEMTDGDVAIYQSGAKGHGLAALRMVPVTEESVVALAKETSAPPTRLIGLADWLDYFLRGAEPRRAADQFEVLVKGHGELGMRDLQWAIGRSVLLYDSKVPGVSRFPGVPLAQIGSAVIEQAPHWPTWAYMNSEYCPLQEVEQQAERLGMRVWPWLAMQRHYGAGGGGIFRSKWFALHPEWHEWRKHATKPRGTEACFFFPEVRKERVDILCEVAERNSEGVMADAVRQPPMLGYHPTMVAAYKAMTGIDAQTIDGSLGKVYEDWIRWRAGFFTETLRELKSRLAPIRERRKRDIPVVVRIPSAGMFHNLAQGFDVETWCRERLVDVIQLEPLEDLNGKGSHDVRPYVELGHRHQILVWGGINANTFSNYPVIMKRALGLIDAHVDGIYFFESNLFCTMDHLRWIVPLLGNRGRLAEFLKTSNLEACYPVRATNACAGFDNHSGLHHWSVYEEKGFERL